MSGTIRRDPEIMSGRPCFEGTRVPVRNLLDYLAKGHALGVGPINEPVAAPAAAASA